MIKTLTLTLFAAAALAGCNKTPTAVNDMVTTDNAAANDVGVELPPAIVASQIYRCKDNSVVYVDWLAGDQAANFRAEQNSPPTHLTAEAQGGALTAEGYSLIGSSTAKTVTLTRPGKGQQACKA
ncbi:MAG: hypothetical protein ABIN83_04390 [Sphingomicrobium sp.]